MPPPGNGYRRAWKYTLVATFDGLIHALLTAGAYGWLWPEAVQP